MICLPATSHVPVLVTEQKIKRSALPKVTREVINTQSSLSRKGGQEAIKMIKNPKKHA